MTPLVTLALLGAATALTGIYTAADIAYARILARRLDRADTARLAWSRIPD